MNIDLEKLIKKYGGSWVAFNEDVNKVVASGKNAKAVFIMAQDKGIKIPNLFKVPSKLIAYIG